MGNYLSYFHISRCGQQRRIVGHNVDQEEQEQQHQQQQAQQQQPPTLEQQVKEEEEEEDEEVEKAKVNPKIQKSSKKIFKWKQKKLKCKKKLMKLRDRKRARNNRRQSLFAPRLSTDSFEDGGDSIAHAPQQESVTVNWYCRDYWRLTRNARSISTDCLINGESVADLRSSSTLPSSSSSSSSPSLSPSSSSSAKSSSPSSSIFFSYINLTN